MNERNAASEASASTPAPTPSSSAWKASLTDLLASSPALSDLLVLTPASLSQLWTLSTAPWRVFCSSGISLVTPDSSRNVIRQPSAITLEEADRRATAAPQPVPREPADDRREDRRDDRRRDDRDDDESR